MFADEIRCLSFCLLTTRKWVGYRWKVVECVFLIVEAGWWVHGSLLYYSFYFLSVWSFP